MPDFQIVSLMGVNTLTIKGDTGAQGPQGIQGVAGPGAGAFEVDSGGDLMPMVNVTSDAFYELDSNLDLQPTLAS